MIFPEKVKTVFAFMLAAFILVSMPQAFAALADGGPCSVSVTPKTPLGETVSDGAVSVMRVEGRADNSDAARLAEQAAENSLFDRTVQIGADGTAYFADVPEGLWLIVQTENSDGYAPFAPFLLELPMKLEGRTIRDAAAEPKLSPPIHENDDPPPKKDDEKLPYTGQLRWPVPVLAAVGLILISVSVVVGRRKRCE